MYGLGTDFIETCSMTDLAKVKRYVMRPEFRDGSWTRFSTSNGETALHMSVLYGREAITDFLLESLDAVDCLALLKYHQACALHEFENRIRSRKTKGAAGGVSAAGGKTSTLSGPTSQATLPQSLKKRAMLARDSSSGRSIIHNVLHVPSLSLVLGKHSQCFTYCPEACDRVLKQILADYGQPSVVREGGTANAQATGTTPLNNNESIAASIVDTSPAPPAHLQMKLDVPPRSWVAENDFPFLSYCKKQFPTSVVDVLGVLDHFNRPAVALLVTEEEGGKGSERSFAAAKCLIDHGASLGTTFFDSNDGDDVSIKHQYQYRVPAESTHFLNDIRVTNPSEIARGGRRHQSSWGSYTHFGNGGGGGGNYHGSYTEEDSGATYWQRASCIPSNIFSSIPKERREEVVLRIASEIALLEHGIGRLSLSEMSTVTAAEAKPAILGETGKDTQLNDVSSTNKSNEKADNDNAEAVETNAVSDTTLVRQRAQARLRASLKAKKKQLEACQLFLCSPASSSAAMSSSLSVPQLSPEEAASIEKNGMTLLSYLLLVGWDDGSYKLPRFSPSFLWRLRRFKMKLGVRHLSDDDEDEADKEARGNNTEEDRINNLMKALENDLCRAKELQGEVFRTKGNFLMDWVLLFCDHGADPWQRGKAAAELYGSQCGGCLATVFRSIKEADADHQDGIPTNQSLCAACRRGSVAGKNASSPTEAPTTTTATIEEKPQQKEESHNRLVQFLSAPLTAAKDKTNNDGQGYEDVLNIYRKKGRKSRHRRHNKYVRGVICGVLNSVNEDNWRKERMWERSWCDMFDAQQDSSCPCSCPNNNNTQRATSRRLLTAQRQVAATTPTTDSTVATTATTTAAGGKIRTSIDDFLAALPGDVKLALLQDRYNALQGNADGGGWAVVPTGGGSGRGNRNSSSQGRLLSFVPTSGTSDNGAGAPPKKGRHNNVVRFGPNPPIFLTREKRGTAVAMSSLLNRSQYLRMEWAEDM